MNVFPDFGSLGGIGDLKLIIGAALTIILVVAVLMLIVSAIGWALTIASGNYSAASKARTGVLLALGSAILAGGAVTWMNWLINLGEHL